jgi:hypothetical protein
MLITLIHSILFLDKQLYVYIAHIDGSLFLINPISLKPRPYILPIIITTKCETSKSKYLIYYMVQTKILIASLVSEQDVLCSPHMECTIVNRNTI